MFTKNFYNYRWWVNSLKLPKGNASSPGQIIADNVGFIRAASGPENVNYNNYIILTYNSDANRSSYSVGNLNFNVFLLSKVGSSDTIETINDTDINVLNNVTSTISNINIAKETPTKHKTTYSITGTNNNNTEVVIKEIGIYKKFPHLNGNTAYIDEDSNCCHYMMIRQVLSEPITVAAGGIYSITIETIENYAPIEY